MFFSSDFCGAIEVTGDTSNSEGGLYLPTDKRASDAPNSPVWKIPGRDRFIFNDGSAEGWRIGTEKSVNTGGYYCKGKHILIILVLFEFLTIYAHKSFLGDSSSLPILLEEWSDADVCGSDGTVQVKCTKIIGKPFEKRVIVPRHILGQPRKIREQFLTKVNKVVLQSCS